MLPFHYAIHAVHRRRPVSGRLVCGRRPWARPAPRPPHPAPRAATRLGTPQLRSAMGGAGAVPRARLRGPCAPAIPGAAGAAAGTCPGGGRAWLLHGQAHRRGACKGCKAAHQSAEVAQPTLHAPPPGEGGGHWAVLHLAHRRRTDPNRQRVAPPPPVSTAAHPCQGAHVPGRCGPFPSAGARLREPHGRSGVVRETGRHRGSGGGGGGRACGCGDEAFQGRRDRHHGQKLRLLDVRGGTVRGRSGARSGSGHPTSAQAARPREQPPARGPAGGAGWTPPSNARRGSAAPP
jgi:hypothetical protein